MNRLEMPNSSSKGSIIIGGITGAIAGAIVGGLYLDNIDVITIMPFDNFAVGMIGVIFGAQFGNFAVGSIFGVIFGAPFGSFSGPIIGGSRRCGLIKEVTGVVLGGIMGGIVGAIIGASIGFYYFNIMAAPAGAMIGCIFGVIFGERVEGRIIKRVVGGILSGILGGVLSGILGLVALLLIIAIGNVMYQVIYIMAGAVGWLLLTFILLSLAAIVYRYFRDIHAILSASFGDIRGTTVKVWGVVYANQGAMYSGVRGVTVKGIIGAIFLGVIVWIIVGVTPTSIESPIKFVMSYNYAMDEPIEIRIRNNGNVSYYYQRVLGCPNIRFYGAFGQRNIPSGHCDQIITTEIGPGEEADLWTWHQSECAAWHFSRGCYQSCRVKPGRYGVFEQFYSEGHEREFVAGRAFVITPVAGQPARCRPPDESIVEINLNDPGGTGTYAFEPADLTFSAGETVTMLLKSETEFHTFTVDELGMDVSVDGGTVEIFTFTFDRAGIYDLICIPHEALGMKGRITVK